MSGAAPGAVLVRLAPFLVGASWGLSQPLTKIAVVGGWEPWGILTWQAVLMVGTGAVALRLRRLPVPKGARAWGLCAVAAYLGTMIPHTASYTAVQALPAGVMAIVLSTSPMLSLPVAIVLGLDRATLRRVAGVCCGAVGVVAIVLAAGTRSAEIPLWALAIAMIAPICYALNGNILDLLRRAGLYPVQLLFGAAVLMLPVALGLALVSDQARLPGATAPDLAMLATVSLHMVGYITLLWLIGRAGAVYASLTNPVVTGFGVVWSMLILAERYAPLIWVGLAAILAGLALVRPRGP